MIIVHNIKIYIQAWIIVIIQALAFSGCTSPVLQDVQNPPLERFTRAKHISLEDKTWVTIAIPDGYTSIAPSQASTYSDFYCTDIAQPEIRKMYVSNSDPRSHLVVKVYDNKVLPSGITQYDKLNTLVKGVVREVCRDLPGMPLTEVYIDNNGNPYAYIMMFSRYNSSSDWRSLPLTNVDAKNADSVECNLIYHTIRGRRIYGVEYYSLESFEKFSFMEKRAVLESIKIQDAGTSL